VTLLTQQLAAIGVPKGMVDNLGDLVNRIDSNAEKKGNLIAEVGIFNSQLLQSIHTGKEKLKRQIGFVRGEAS
jgi:hypothetical protein